MEVIQIGSIAILLKWLLLAAAALIGVIAVWIWLKLLNGAKESKQIVDLILNSLFVGFFVWKGSLLLLEPGLVWKQPLSLLYFTGGKDGLIIAIVSAVLYFFVKASKQRIESQLKIQIVIFYSSIAVGIYHLLYALFLQEDILFHTLIGLAALVESTFNKVQARKLFSFVILFSFFYLILSLLLLHSMNKILLFTSDQWLFFFLILLSLYFSNKKV
ncbi:hypothetical protein IEO70_06575 [Bacillus sp. AGMB 02131]|uniref:Uncharacterized protein n=1 Tax=Peribacillus faecalis TaxID=2772559 RepID=A0A927CWH1_9BACI|nr:hypothetical protein [Peribacillus faecalis]MBD3108027.1 hypothetical protein [Peribacillus faecalis]